MHMTENNIEIATEPRIAVVGVGGAGCNVISAIIDSLCTVDTVIINTDKDALHRISADTKIYICKEVLKGEGVLEDAVLGKKCTEIHKKEIRQALAGHDVVFVIAGLGGSTGTGATSVVIDAAKSQEILTFAVMISPFSFEERRKKIAREGYKHIRTVCERTILVDNDLILTRMSDLTMDRAFVEVNKSIMRHVIDCMAAVEETFINEIFRQRPIETTRETPNKTYYPIGLFISA